MQFVTTTFHSCRRKYYFGANKIMPFKKARWSFSVMIAALYFYRSYGLQYNVITYLIFFYMLQLLTDYITPKGLSNIDEDDSNQIPQIQTMLRDDFQYVPEDISQKPLVSQINEYQVWERVLLAFTLGLICTLFKAIQIDVFWPLLMVYFVGLVIYTVQKIVKKMKKYRYSLSDFTKKPDLL